MNLSFEKLFDRISPSIDSKKEKLHIDVPNIRFKDRKNWVHNFKHYVEQFNNREEELLEFIKKEWKVEVSVKEDGKLCIKAKRRYTAENFTNLMVNFAKTFVICKSCGCSDTNLIRESGIKLLKCNKCFSTFSV